MLFTADFKFDRRNLLSFFTYFSMDSLNDLFTSAKQ